MRPSHLAALEALAPCRTAALGGHLSQCTAGEALAYSSHACKNRHGPTCQHAAATPWLAQQRTLLLPVPSLLVPFTLPAALRPGARAHQNVLDHLLLQTAAAALPTRALAPRHLGGQSGMVGGLHTWPRDLAYHPPVHSLVPGGALSSAGTQWLAPRCEAWLVPVRARARLLRGTCKAALPTAGLHPPVPPQVWNNAWVTHCQPAGTGTEVLSDLAPSLRRRAITNKRLEKLDNGPGTCRLQESGRHTWKHRTLPAEAFLPRFLQQVLPRGGIKVRYDGLLSPRRRKGLPPIQPPPGRRPQQRRGPNTSSAPRPPTVLAHRSASAALPELWGGTRGREAPRASSPSTTLAPRGGERVSRGAVHSALDRASMTLLCRLRGRLWPGHAPAPKAAGPGRHPGGHIALANGIEGGRRPLVPPLCAAGVPRFPASTASPPH